MSKYNFEQIRSDYETPPELVFEGLKMTRIFTGYACDVCCSRENIPAFHHFIKGEKDGLKEDWYDINWCNPPYKYAPIWVKKAVKEQQKGNHTVMLIPARTETKYWHDYILDHFGGTNRNHVKVKFLRKGYRFINPDTCEKMGVYKNALALVYFEGIRNDTQK